MSTKDASQYRKNEVQQQSDEIELNTSGKNHQVRAKGNTAKGIAVAASAIVGFAVGLLLVRR